MNRIAELIQRLLFVAKTHERTFMVVTALLILWLRAKRSVVEKA